MLFWCLIHKRQTEWGWKRGRKLSSTKWKIHSFFLCSPCCSSYAFSCLNVFYPHTAAAINESCYFNEQCEEALQETECRDNRCICRFEKTAIVRNDKSIECIGELLQSLFFPFFAIVLAFFLTHLSWDTSHNLYPVLCSLLIAIKEKEYTPPTQVNPAMYLILVVMALMFIIICVVLRLFSKWVWHLFRYFSKSQMSHTTSSRLDVNIVADND